MHSRFKILLTLVLLPGASIAQEAASADVKLISDWPVHKTHVPVYAFYGEWDLTQANPVLFTAEDSRKLMVAAGNKFEAIVYPRAEHAFLRVGEDPKDKNPANAVADKAGLIRIEQILKTSFP
jgi:dienelactone hydrolase